MRTIHLYDAASSAARYTVQDMLAVAAREQTIREARSTRQRRAPVPIPVIEVGRPLVRLGQWLQTMAHQPTYREETI